MGFQTIEKNKNAGNRQPVVDKNGQSPFFTSSIQPKLRINAPDDMYEKEADAVADQVMRSPAAQMGSDISESSFTLVQRKCAACEKEEKLQREEKGEEELILPEPAEDIPIVDGNVQRKCTACELEEKETEIGRAHV